MSSSQKPGNLLQELIKFTGNKIKNPGDIEIILETSLQIENKSFDDLIFKAKYLNGLGKIIHSGLSNMQLDEQKKSLVQDDSVEKVKNEFKINLKQFILMLKEFIKHSPDDVYKRFDEKYFNMDQASMVNLTTLIYDLSWIKKFRNSEKR